MNYDTAIKITFFSCSIIYILVNLENLKKKLIFQLDHETNSSQILLGHPG